VPRGFGFVHHSIAILYHEVPNPNITIRNFFIGVGGPDSPSALRRAQLDFQLRLAETVRAGPAPSCLCAELSFRSDITTLVWGAWNTSWCW
jgi:hypothetical protein